MRPRSYSNGSINTVSIIERDNVLIVCYSAFKAIHQRSLPIFFMWIASRFTTGLMPGKRAASLAYTIGKGKVALRVSLRSKRTRFDNGQNSVQKTSTKLVPSFVTDLVLM